MTPGMAEQMYSAESYRHPAPNEQPEYARPSLKNDKTFKNYYYQRDHRRFNPVPAFYTMKDLDVTSAVYSAKNLPPVVNHRYKYTIGVTPLPEETENYPIHYVK